jgi:hypothetical protein
MKVITVHAFVFKLKTEKRDTEANGDDWPKTPCGVHTKQKSELKQVEA